MPDTSISNAAILLLDQEDYSAGILLDDLRQRGFMNIHRVAAADQLPAMLQKLAPLVVLFNFHFQRQDSLEDCRTIKLLAPDTAVLAIVSAGPAIKMVRQWTKDSQAIDVVIEKPLSDERFFLLLRDLVQTRLSSRQLLAKASRMANLLPAGAVASLNRQRGEEAEMFQAAVLFTDIRRSTETITQLSPQDFFSLLNRSLTAQSAHISTFEGAVIKYTGDGVFAVFRGMGRSYLALRCAIALARSESQQILPFGIGVAEGLVLAGLVGDSNRAGLRRQYDVIGATVNLSSRLCSMARPGEVITTKQVHGKAKISVLAARHIGAVAIRGFDMGIDCVAYDAHSPNPRTPHDC